VGGSEEKAGGVDLLDPLVNARTSVCAGELAFARLVERSNGTATAELLAPGVAHLPAKRMLEVAHRSPTAAEDYQPLPRLLVCLRELVIREPEEAAGPPTHATTQQALLRRREC
jgi:hypothetical protein